MVNNFQGKTAVVTGAASGIGFALAQKCVDEGMNVVLADVEKEALAEASKTLHAKGAHVEAVLTDVSREDDVAHLEKRSAETFGLVHLLCNNAGVATPGTVWEATSSDWNWVVGVNLLGVAHACRAFLPSMLKHGEPAHIVNTASMAGLLPYHPPATYHVTKHAVVAMSEHLYHSLGQREANVKVSVLCPGFVRTAIFRSQRNSPSEEQREAAELIKDDEAFADIPDKWTVLEPPEIARQVFEAIAEERFWIFTHGSEFDHLVTGRFDSIRKGTNPRIFWGVRPEVERPR